MERRDQFRQMPFMWLVHAIIIGLILWVGGTLYSVDKKMTVVEFRLTSLETSVSAINARHSANDLQNQIDALAKEVHENE